MVKKEIVIKKAFPVYFQPMCDLIITTNVLFVPLRPKRKNGSVVLCHTLCDDQRANNKRHSLSHAQTKRRKVIFFHRMKANKLVYFAMYIRMNNDISKV